MRVLVHGTVALLRPLFVSRAHPRQRFADAQDRLFDAGNAPGLARPVTDRSAWARGGYGVLEAALHDGYHVAFAQQVWGLFDPLRRPEASEWQFDRFAEAGVMEMIHSWLDAFATDIGGAAPLDEVACSLVPADPANRHEMVGCAGLSCFAGVPGHILLALWPSEGNLARLGPALARAFGQNLRWAAHAPAEPATLADYLVLEGLAASFVSRHFPDLAVPPWLVSFRAPADWDTSLAHVAGLLGLDRYDDLVGNVYGTRVEAADVRTPVAEPLSDEERAYAWEITRPALTAADERLIAAHLYGDELVAAQGHAAVGLPNYAGFEIGYRVAQAYLEATKCELRDTLRAPTDEIMRAADLVQWDRA